MKFVHLEWLLVLGNDYLQQKMKRLLVKIVKPFLGGKTERGSDKDIEETD